MQAEPGLEGAVPAGPPCRVPTAGGAGGRSGRRQSRRAGAAAGAGAQPGAAQSVAELGLSGAGRAGPGGSDGPLGPGRAPRCRRRVAPASSRGYCRCWGCCSAAPPGLPASLRRSPPARRVSLGLEGRRSWACTPRSAATAGPLFTELVTRGAFCSQDGGKATRDRCFWGERLRDCLQQGVILCYSMQQILLPSDIQAPATVPVSNPGSENHRGHRDGVSDQVVIPVHHNAWELHVYYLCPAGVKMLVILPPLLIHGNATSELG